MSFLIGVSYSELLPHENIVLIDKGGNTVYLNTADGRGESYLPLPESGSFGPQVGEWS